MKLNEAVKKNSIGQIYLGKLKYNYTIFEAKR